MYKTSILLSILIISTGCVQNSPKRLCYIHLGCLNTNSSWYSSNRPYNPPTSSREQINTTFHLFTSEMLDGEDVYMDYETFVSKVFVKNATRNFFLIHGFLSWGKADWIMDIKDELINMYKTSVNVFSVDWSGHNVDYAQTAANARVVGLEIARFINFILVDGENVSVTTIHIIGHSLGAHIAGYVGERVPGLERITGLDPAGRHFAGMPLYVRLDPSDAKFVDVIHSDIQGYGTNQPMGHVDFYANGDGEQPGCGALNMFPQFINQGVNTTLQETGTCSHGRAHQYFIESLQAVNASIKSTCKIVAYKCNNYQELAEEKCISNCDPDESDRCMFLGLEARRISNKKNVMMYFKTGNYKPYCVAIYRIYIEIADMSLQSMYAILNFRVYDAKGTAISWILNDGHPMQLNSHTKIFTTVSSPKALSSEDMHMVNLHWNSRFYPFGLLRKALINGFIRIKRIKISTVDNKLINLCPRGSNTVDVYENVEIMFYADTCK